MTTSLRLSEDAVIGTYPAQSIHAGQPIVPLGHRKDGRPIFPVMGGAPDDDEDDRDDEDLDDEDENDDDDEDDESNSEDDDESEDDEDGPEGKKSKKQQSKRDDSPAGLKRKVAALEDEKNRLYRGRERAREERDDLRKEVEKLKKDGVSDESVKADNEKLTKSIDKLTTTNTELRLQIAFLSDNTYEWQNPGLALRAADLSDVEIDDDGKVMGLVSALEKLANENPFLLKQKEKKRTTTSTQRTGQRPAKKSTSKQKAEDARVAAKYNVRGAGRF